MASGKAVVIQKHGGTDVLEGVSDHSVRAPGNGEVLLKLVATSVNPVDVYVRSGMYPSKIFPKVIGGDAAGTVFATGEGSKFKPGDAVYALSDAFVPSSQFEGTYAEYALFLEDWVAPAPDPSILPLEHAAAVPLVALTALQALERAAPKPEQRVLVFGASGGVGHIAVQLAKVHYGLHVTAVSSSKHADWVRSLGADAVWEYDTAGGAEGLKTAFTDGNKFDIIFDVVGGELLEVAMKHALKDGGVVTHVLNRGTVSAADAAYIKASEDGTGPKYVKTFVHPSGKQLELLAGMINAHKLAVKVALVLPLEEAGKAHDIVIDGHAGGKVVLKI